MNTAPSLIAIAHDLAAIEYVEEAEPRHYPFDYAYDFAQSNIEAFGLPRTDSRRAFGMLLNDACRMRGDDIEQTIVTLADAYLATRRQALPMESRLARIRVARECFWHNLEYPDAATALAAPLPTITMDFTAA